jgi:hypothetical protein
MPGLFLTCTKESLFIKHTRIHVLQVLRTCVCGMKRKPYLECQLLVHESKSPSLLVLCSKTTAPIQPSPLSFPMPIPANTTFIYIQTKLTRLTRPLFLGQAHYLRPITSLSGISPNSNSFVLAAVIYRGQPNIKFEYFRFWIKYQDGIDRYKKN